MDQEISSTDALQQSRRSLAQTDELVAESRRKRQELTGIRLDNHWAAKIREDWARSVIERAS